MGLITLISACQTTPESPQSLPTLIRFPTLTATLNPSASPTQTSTSTMTPLPTQTNTPLPTHTPRLRDMATDTITPTELPSATMTATALPDIFVFGQSASGRDLLAYRYGTGQHIIMLVAGIHSGFEANTSVLLSQIQVRFESNPELIDENITFLIVPVLNPDGEAQGRVLAGRFNGNGVDLNRNWGCGWSEEAFFSDNRVDAGSEAFSEPETIALGSLIQRIHPVAVIFYHSAANGVFAGNCGDNSADSDSLARIYGDTSGYPYGEDFSEYPITGTAPGWVDSIGIPALDVELATAEGSEFDRNLRAIVAIQAWVQP